MTWTAIGSPQPNVTGSSSTFSLTPAAVGNLFLVSVANGSNNTVFATALSSTNVAWQPVGYQNWTVGTANNTWTVFSGIVTAASTATVTVTWSGTAPSATSFTGQEFNTTAGGWTVDTVGFVNSTGTNTWASLTPKTAGELYWGECGDTGVATAGSTTGFTYFTDSDQNGMAYNLSCGSGATAPVWGDSGMVIGVMVMIGEISPDDFPQILPGPVWLDLFKPGLPRPRPPVTPPSPVYPGPLSRTPNGASLTDAVPRQAVPGFIPGIPPASSGVTCSGSFALAPLAFPFASTVTHVGDSSNVTGTTQALTNSYSSTARNTLVAYIDGYTSGNNPISVSSVTDSTGINTWTVVNGGGSFSGTSFYGCCAVAYCINAAAVTSVTAHFSTAPTDIGYLQVSEFSGVTPTARVDGAASASPGGATFTSYITPQIATTAPAGDIVIGVLAEGNTWDSVTPGTQLFDTQASWLITTAPGTWSFTFVKSTPNDVEGSLTVAIGTPLNQVNVSSFDQPQVNPGATWLALFKPAVPRPRPVPPAVQGVSSTGSFSLAPLAFISQGAQSSPDVTQITPGTTWLSLFKPWIQKPQPVPPAFQSANATASFTLASLVFQGQGSQTSPDVPQVNPGAAWLSLFKHKPLPQDLPAQPPANLVTTAGSFTLAPLAFQAQGSQTAPDQLQIQPGTTWIRLFRPDLYKPVPAPPAFQNVNGTASFTLAPLAFSAQGSRTSPDVPQILPGTTWFDLFKPWFPRPRPVPPAFQGVNGTASFALAPLAFAAQGSQTSPDIPQAQPGPVWLRLFKPAQAKPVPWIPSAPFIGVQGEASFALAPLAFAAQGSATSPDLPQIVPGTTWLSWFKHRQRPVVPVLGPVAASGSFSLAPLAFLAQGNQTSPDVPQVDPGAFWLRLFKPWVQKPVPPLPARDQVSTSGSLSLASLRLAAHGAQTSPDVPQISPGTTWLSLFKRKPRPIVPAFQGIGGAGGVTLAPLTFTASGSVSLVPGNFLQVNPGPGWLARFKHWQRPLRPDALPTHVNATGRITLGTLAFLGKGPSTPATIALGVPYFQWITGNPQLNWRIP